MANNIVRCQSVFHRVSRFCDFGPWPTWLDYMLFAIRLFSWISSMNPWKSPW